MIIRCLPRRRSARHHADGIDVDLAAILPRQRFYVRHMLHRLLEGDAARDVREQRVAVADREGLAGRRGAGIHDQRACAAIGLGLGMSALEPDELAREIEILTRRPGELDYVEPLLGVGVARLLNAQRCPEHLEFAPAPTPDA